VATVKRKDLREAVSEFIAVRKPLAESKDGKRAKLSPIYASNVAMWLREFAKTFPNTAVCDLGKDQLNLYLQAHAKLSSKSRNDRRAVVRMFLAWCVKRDYLANTHRLLEADGMVRETVELQEIDFYRPPELRVLLEAARPDLIPIIALCGLGGLRLEETTRLDWADVWRVPGHIEVTAAKSKTRARRLVEICPALGAWLEPYRAHAGLIWSKSKDVFHDDFSALRDSLTIPARRNGLRHAYVTFHFALHQNENLTAAQAGHSPAMIHAHYKGLATKAEAGKWFNVMPAKSAKNVIPLPAVSP
jgi:integrase